MFSQNILIVGGSFDNAGGRASGVVAKMIQSIQNDCANLEFYNGGFVDELHNTILPSVKNHDIVLWMPNVPNTEEKKRDVKAINPHAILVSSKRNDNEKYSFSELVNRALQQKSNLTIEFSKQNDGTFHMRVFDPLGTLFYDGDDINAMMSAMMTRAVKLTTFTRIPSVPATGNAPEVPNEERFFGFARGCADIFHNLINPDASVTRFLGNMSFRCRNGYSSPNKENDIIYVSRRNVDKRLINAESFVPTYRGEDGKVYYYGENKPSVDTPVQQRLYEHFPQINYMLHAHCYIDMPEAITTFHPVPCGAIEEVNEILDIVRFRRMADKDFLAINLIGHGCILMAADIKYFEALQEYKDKCFVSRKMPENIIDTFISTVPGNLKWEPADFDVNVLNNLSGNDYQFSMVKYGYLAKGSMQWSLKEMIRNGENDWTEAKVNQCIFDFVHDLRTQDCAQRIFKAEQNGIIYFLVLLRDHQHYHCDAIITCKKRGNI